MQACFRAKLPRAGQNRNLPAKNGFLSALTRVEFSELAGKPVDIVIIKRGCCER